jgi:hypothetical protein
LPADRLQKAFSLLPSGRSRKPPEPATIITMQLFLIAMRVLEAMFFFGLIGSSVVVLISFWEDAIELFGKD